MAKLNSDILGKEINALFSDGCTLRHPPLFKDVYREVDIIAKCSRKTYAIRYKGHTPNLSDVASIKTYVDNYEKKMEENVTPILFFVGKRARDYVQDFADEENILLYPVRNIRHLRKDIPVDFGLSS